MATITSKSAPRWNFVSSPRTSFWYLIYPGEPSFTLCQTISEAAGEQLAVA
jgi:hypothetical protein